jgi:hypothetical protein
MSPPSYVARQIAAKLLESPGTRITRDEARLCSPAKGFKRANFTLRAKAYARGHPTSSTGQRGREKARAAIAELEAAGAARRDGDWVVGCPDALKSFISQPKNEEPDVSA